MVRLNDALLRCPLCWRKLWLSNVVNHRKQKRSSLKHAEFEARLVEAIKSGAIVPKVYGPPPKGLESGTQKLQRKKQKGLKGGRHVIVQGGRMSPK